MQVLVRKCMPGIVGCALGASALKALAGQPLHAEEGGTEDCAAEPEVCTDFSMIIRQSIANRLLRACYWLCQSTTGLIAR